MEISWEYSGEKGLNSTIYVDHIEIFRDGKEVVKKDVSIKIEGTGSSSTINL